MVFLGGSPKASETMIFEVGEEGFFPILCTVLGYFLTSAREDVKIG